MKEGSVNDLTGPVVLSFLPQVATIAKSVTLSLYRYALECEFGDPAS